MVRRRALNLKFVSPLLVIIPLVLAHPHDEPSQADMDMAMPKTTSTGMVVAAMSSTAVTSPTSTVPVTYFTHSEYSGLMLAHIGLMTVAWFFLLPVGEI